MSSWTLGEPLPAARYSIAVAATKGAIYAVGGSVGFFENATAQNDRYIPTDNEISSQQENFPIVLAAVVLATSTVVIALGVLLHLKRRRRSQKQ